MCGIFGKTNFKKSQFQGLSEGLDLLKHRGPDQKGVYVDENLFMGHQRLSIIDLSDNGKQPMTSKSEDVIITVNGEIYNYKEIKKELDHKFTFKSESDSEVLIYGYKEWGIDRLLNKIDGMFALTLYDKINRKLFLVRDRVGIKPLYYSKINSEICWSSELKSIKHFYSKDNLEIDHTGFYDYLTYRYIPAPKTMYKNVFKLEPANYIEISVNQSNKMKSICYWKPNISHDNKRSLDETCIKFRDELSKSVNSQLVSDVPVGLFLSGGLDSASIASCLPDKSNLKTFTIGFEDKNYDESAYALYISEYFKLKNTTEYFKADKIKKMFEMNLEWFDEPAFNSSNFPVYQLSKLTKKKCTVALSGDGGDELFGGYRWYKFMEKLNTIRLPFFSFTRPLLQLGFNLPINKISKLFKALDLLVTPDILEAYSIVHGGLSCKEKQYYKNKWKIDSDYDDYWFFRKFDNPKLDIKSRFQHIDFHTFLPEVCLTKIDRTSMQNSLECRVPFLSNSMLEFAFSIPPKLRFHNNDLKGIMKESMREILPQRTLKMVKKGFSAPIDYNEIEFNKTQKEHMRYFNFIQSK
tara:strand:+ start:614 stop:2350 length:1737 start_codon:yes stop_codon:yes gene_type:complete